MKNSNNKLSAGKEFAKIQHRLPSRKSLITKIEAFAESADDTRISIYYVASNPGYGGKDWINSNKKKKKFQATYLLLESHFEPPSTNAKELLDQELKQISQSDSPLMFIFGERLPQDELSQSLNARQYHLLSERHLALTGLDLIHLSNQLKIPKNLLSDGLLDYFLKETQGWPIPLFDGLKAISDLIIAKSNIENTSQNTGTKTPKKISEKELKNCFFMSAESATREIIEKYCTPDELTFLTRYAWLPIVTPSIIELIGNEKSDIKTGFKLVEKQILGIHRYFEPQFTLKNPLLRRTLRKTAPQGIVKNNLSEILDTYLNLKEYSYIYQLCIDLEGYREFILCIRNDKWGFFNALNAQQFKQIGELSWKNNQPEETSQFIELINESALAINLNLDETPELARTIFHEKEENTSIWQQLANLTHHNSSQNVSELEKKISLTETQINDSDYQKNPLILSTLGSIYLNEGVLNRGIDHLENAYRYALLQNYPRAVISSQIYLVLTHHWCANLKRLYSMCQTTTNYTEPSSKNLNQQTQPPQLSVWSEICGFSSRIESTRSGTLIATVNKMENLLINTDSPLLKFFLNLNLALWSLYQREVDQNQIYLDAAEKILLQHPNKKIKPLWASYLYLSGLSLLTLPPKSFPAKAKYWLRKTQPISQKFKGTSELDIWYSISQIITIYISARVKLQKDHIRQLEKIVENSESLQYRLVNMYAKTFLASLYWDSENDLQAMKIFSQALITAENFSFNGSFVLLSQHLMPLMRRAKEDNTSLHFINQTLEHLDQESSKINHHLDRLSKRELQILELITQGLSNEEIADQLCRSKGTVKLHVHNIYKKLSIRNRVEAIQTFTQWQQAKAL